MSDADLIHYTSQALLLVLLLSLPTIIVAALSGLLVGLLQAVTQIQDQTLSFAIKLVAVIISLALTARWLGLELHNFTVNLFNNIGLVPP